MREVCLGLLVGLGLRSEVHTLTRRQAVEAALRQNPELMMARLEEQKAAERIHVARDPFVPKLFAGSGAAYSSGFPMSVEGSAPTVVQARAVASVYNRQQSYQLAGARENARGLAIETEAKRELIASRALDLWLAAYWSGRALETAHAQASSLDKVVELMRLRAAEGRETPLEVRRAELEAAKSRHRIEVLEAEAAASEGSLASVLGLGEGDRVRAAAEEAAPMELPSSEDEAVRRALADNRQIRRLESELKERGLEAESHRASRWPRLSLVAQYGLFARFNNYEDFFQRFQRHNGQIGVAVEVPLFSGPAAGAQTRQAGAEAARLRIEIDAARVRIGLEARRAFQEVRRSASARELARLDLEVARETLSAMLARYEEGRVTLKQVEEARSEEQARWLAYYDTQHAAEKARFALLGQTGDLIGSMR